MILRGFVVITIRALRPQAVTQSLARPFARGRANSTTTTTQMQSATSDSRVARRQLYPDIEVYDSGHLAVGDGHELFYEQCGSPSGTPVVFLHGGPGSGCSPMMRRFFDPAAYRIILFDQRGCGRSTPFASIENNTTWALVGDIEKLREHLGISRWSVFGGSWGSTLALAYAQTHPTAVTSLVLRGIFCLRRHELEWFYQEGASRIFPDAWEHYLNEIPEEERGDLIAAYHKRLTSADPDVMVKAAKAWSIWEGTTSKLFPDPDYISTFAGDKFSLSFARIECHYFYERGFFTEETALLRKENVDKIRHIPCVIVQGRYDLVCPFYTAYDLHKLWPEAEFKVIGDAGHSAYEPGILAELLDATDKFR